MRSYLASIIIPVYNVSPFLEKCIDSLISQTYKNLEIILVDDGSTDGSADICDRFAKADKRIRIFHTSNRGQALARNTGLEKATGHFVAFVDGDDFLGENHIENMVRQIRDNDMLCTGYQKITTDAKITEIRKLKQCKSSKYILYSTWCKFYKTDFIKQNQIQFYDTNLGEDIIFTFDCLSRTNRIGISDVTSYFYVTNPKSTTHHVYQETLPKPEIILNEVGHILETRPQQFLEKKHLVTFALIKMGLFLTNEIAQKTDDKTELLNRYEIIMSKIYNIIKINHLGIPKYFCGEKFSTNLKVLFYWLIRKLHLDKLVFSIIF